MPCRWSFDDEREFYLGDLEESGRREWLRELIGAAAPPLLAPPTIGRFRGPRSARSTTSSPGPGSVPHHRVVGQHAHVPFDGRRGHGGHGGGDLGCVQVRVGSTRVGGSSAGGQDRGTPERGREGAQARDRRERESGMRAHGLGRAWRRGGTGGRHDGVGAAARSQAGPRVVGSRAAARSARLQRLVFPAIRRRPPRNDPGSCPAID
jgi:hypothetical protein